MFVLTNQGMWNHGKNYSNQYGLVWSAAMCYLEYHPDDTEMIEAFDAKWARSGEFISPAGFYYEDSGLDMPYNLGVHTQNIAAEYHYMRGTKYEADLIKHQTQFFDWLSYNFLVEPDGSYIMVNSAASKRSVPSSVVVWRKDFPISEKIPLARAFVRSKEDVEDEIQRNKDDMTKNGAWPVLPEMTTTGGSQYNPYSIYNRILYQYFPTDEERREAIEMLPYNAKDYFTQHRADRELAFTFVRRPEYYAIFNAGPKTVNSQAFGLGAIWSPEGGTFLLNVGEAKDTKEGNYPLAYNYAWGTKPFKTPLSQNYYRVYENGTVVPEYTVNGERFVASKAIDDLPEGDVTMTYTIGDSGKKKVAFTDDGVNVDVTYEGKFQECFPIMLRKEDKVEMFQNRFRVVRGRAVFEITFDKNVDFELTEKGYKNHRLTLNQLTASTVDDLSYSIRTYIREPELSETAGTIQVEMNNNTTSGGTATVPDIGGGSASLSELTGRTDVTRAQFTAAVVDSLGMLGDPAKYKVFEDIPADAWYREDVLAAVQLGLIVGVDDTHFEPAAIITQEQKEIILERAREFLNKKLSIVKDMMSK